MRPSHRTRFVTVFFVASVSFSLGWPAGEMLAAGIESEQASKPECPAPQDSGYTGITVLKREKGLARWELAIPDHWRKLRSIIDKQSEQMPKQRECPLYVYPGETPPSKQNAYRTYQALKYDANRCVAISWLTKGIDDTREGYIDYKLWYHVSTDGGNTYDEERPLIQRGQAYSPMHPNKYVWVGKNGFCFAAIPPFLRMTNGQILLPVNFAPLNEKGEYENPLGAFTYSRVAVLIGQWNDTGNDLAWDMSQDIRASMEQSSRGLNECAVIELSKPGHILMVMRGSNKPNPKGVIPAIKWKTLSTNYGHTWSKCTPFTYTEGKEFWSPSSCSSFIRSSRTHKVYWIGNISRVLPKGNDPRYPLVIAELDEQSLGLRANTVTRIDDRAADEPPKIQFSNFRLTEDATTGEIVLEMSRRVSWPPDHHFNRSPNSGWHTYVIQVK